MALHPVGHPTQRGARDFAGNRAVSAVDIVVKGCGATPWEVTAAWASRPQLAAGALRGWHFQCSHVWAHRRAEDR